MKKFFGKTVLGAVLSGISIASTGVFGERLTSIGIGLGLILSAVGIRSAIAKNGAGL